MIPKQTKKTKNMISSHYKLERSFYHFVCLFNMTIVPYTLISNVVSTELASTFIYQ